MHILKVYSLMSFDIHSFDIHRSPMFGSKVCEYTGPPSVAHWITNSLRRKSVDLSPKEN